MLLLAQGAQTIILTEGTQAIVFILNLTKQEAEKQSIIKTLDSYLESMMSKLNDALTSLNKAADNVRGAAVEINGITGELHDRCHMLTSQMGAVVYAIMEGISKADLHPQSAGPNPPDGLNNMRRTTHTRV